MDPAAWIAEWTTQRRLLVIVSLLVLTAAIGYGATQIEQQTDLGQFETDSVEAEKLEYIDQNFGADGEDSTTSVQIIIQGENVLSQSSLVSSIEAQMAFRDDPLINDTLATDPFGDVASAIAIGVIQQNRSQQLAQEQAELQAEFDQANETAASLAGTLETVQGLQQEYYTVEEAFLAGNITEEQRDTQQSALENQIDEAVQSAGAALSASEFQAFQAVVTDLRDAQERIFEAQLSYQQGEITQATLDERVQEAESTIASAYDRIQTEVLGQRYAELTERAQTLQERGAALRNLDPTLEEQRQALLALSDEQLASAIEQLFTSSQGQQLLGLMPGDYEPGAPTSEVRIVTVSQVVGDEMVAQGSAPQEIIDSQLRMNDLLEDQYGDDAFAFGQGVVTDELNRSMADSLTLVVPFALVIVLGALLIAYRDILDIVLGILGIALVLVWTFGFMGWAGINFNQIFIAVPVLLIGLSIDYAIHVFMRQREQREEGDDRSPASAMKIALAGLLVALTWVTATAVFGFLANVISPVGPIQDFGIVSAVGITSALVIFGLLIPAMKVSIDTRLEGWGFDRHKRAFGTEGGVFSSMLASGQVLAKRAPILVLVVALVVTAGGAYGASQIDTSFDVQDFISDDPAEWTNDLPEPFSPGEYRVKSYLNTLNDQFAREDLQSEVLIEGDVAGDGALERVANGTAYAADLDAIVTLANGEPDVQGPLQVMQIAAAENPDSAFNQTFHEADTNNDNVPDQNLDAVYAELFEVAPAQAGQYIHRTDDGDIEALRMVFSMSGEAESNAIITQMREVADEIANGNLEATATGQVVLFSIIEDELFQSVFESLLISLLSVILFLMIVYRVTEGSAILGMVTLLPIILSVAWILGTMYLLGMPFNVVTGTITSLTIGLGVAYNIHMSERFRLELDRGYDVWEALHRSVTGTGGALLGSAATTAGGFGVLAVAIIPILQQFGIITALTIIYAFLGSVLVLPTLLVLWLKYVGPDDVDGLGGDGDDVATDDEWEWIDGTGAEDDA